MKRPQSKFTPLPDHICVGVEQSVRSDHAARMGLELGWRLHAPVDLVQAMPVLPQSWTDTEFLTGIDRSAEMLERATSVLEQRMRPLMEQAEERARGKESGSGSGVAASALQVHVRVVEGKPAKVLIDAAAEKQAAWVVLGAHEKRGILDFGSTLRSVFAKANGSVWIQPGPVDKIRRILVPVDMSQESLNALATACALAPAFGARIEAVHWFDPSVYQVAGTVEAASRRYDQLFEKVKETERAEFERSMADFDWKGVEHTTRCEEGLPVTSILDSSGAMDLIVMGSHGRTGLAAVLLGSVTYDVLKQCEKPVLVVRAPDREYQID